MSGEINDIIDRQARYEGWLKLSVISIRMSDGRTARREIVEHGRSAAVLAYDPARRVAMLVRQMRAPVLFAAGQPGLLLEAIAGMRDGGGAADTARREALEEAGLRLENMEPVAEVWPSPGMLTERVSLFLASYGAQDRVAAGGGLASEHEEIEVIEMPLGEIAALADRGELTDMKTLVLVQTLRVRHPELFER